MALIINISYVKIIVVSFGLISTMYTTYAPGLATPYVVLRLSWHPFMQWPTVCVVLSHYLKQWLFIFNKNHQHFRQNTSIFIQEIAFENVVLEKAGILFTP